VPAEAGLTSFPVPLTVHGVGLRPLAGSDAAEYRLLVHRNAGHLGRDYAVDINADEAEQAEAFGRNPEPPVMFGIIADGNLIGRIDLVPVDPPRFGLGYWVSQDHTRRGIATAAVGTAVTYARRTLAASDIYAGVSHGNTGSERVLERNGFTRVASFDTYDRFHRALYVRGPRTSRGTCP
jgi:RimJ/RimL family protein N-acetyltransferase